MLIDNVEIRVQAGNGGSGLAGFRREKFLPFGGPDGGDGGKGGDVYLMADSGIEDLSYFKHKTLFKAESGGGGGKNKMHGLNASNLVIKVPVGTIVYAKHKGKQLIIADLLKNGQKVLVAGGGKGGKGNVHFATATRKAPKIFQAGEAGQQQDIILKMELVVDVCIVGYPNSGKSTLTAAVSGAKPDIAVYPFTTKSPVLGTVDDGLRKYTWAEMPALTEGSHQGKGLGNRFLNHASRASILIYLLDASSPQITENFRCLREEVALFNGELADKKSVIVINKVDEIGDTTFLDSINEKFISSGLPVFLISAREKLGLAELISAIHKLVVEEKTKAVEEIVPEMIFRPSPIDKRS